MEKRISLDETLKKELENIQRMLPELSNYKEGDEVSYGCQTNHKKHNVPRLASFVDIAGNLSIQNSRFDKCTMTSVNLIRFTFKKTRNEHFENMTLNITYDWRLIDVTESTKDYDLEY